MNRSELDRVGRSRETMYRLLARLYKKEIDAPLLAALREMGFDGADVQGPERDALTELAADYAKVFLAAGSNQGTAAVPYESVYTSPERIVMQEAWEQVRAVYRAHGLVLGDAPSDYLEDHMACELEYMAWLCGEGLLEDQLDFLRNHLLAWAPDLCADILNYAGTPLYRAVGRRTLEFLRADAEILPELIAAAKLRDGGARPGGPCDSERDGMASYALSAAAMDQILAALSEKYRIYAPKCLANRGARKGADLVRYGEIRSVKEIVYDRQSDFSPKEVIYPVTQTMIYFTEKDCTASEIDESKGILIFARPCDINGIRRLDQIFLHNGQPDLYYRRMRDRVRFVLMECPRSFERCFCVSMGTNQTDDYAMAVRFAREGVLAAVKAPDFDPYFKDALNAAARGGTDGGAAAAITETDYAPAFVTENERRAVLPKIPDRETLKAAGELEFWKKYDDQCIGCGGCNTVCMTCSCFDTVDIIYHEGSRDGERRRVWSSCMLDDFTRTAGGARARKTPGANMRFKVLHKVYDYNARFGGGEHMCVGCGRCDIRCPKEISFFEAVNTLSAELQAREGTSDG